MSDSGKTQEILLGDSFGDVSISVNGALLRVRADGSVVVCADGPVSVYSAARGMEYRGPGYLIDAPVPLLQGRKALIL